MEKMTPEELDKVHRYFSAECFNRAWDYIDKTSRSDEEGQAMLNLGMASLWHWTQRADCTPGNLSIGCWQVSRIHALLGNGAAAREYGLRCLHHGQVEGTQPFHRAYAYEALARAEAVLGEIGKRDEYLALARQAGETLDDEETLKALLADLATIP